MRSKSKIRKIVFICLVFLYSVELAQAGDSSTIIQGLNDNQGGTYTVPPGTYYLDKKIQVPENTVLSGSVSASGELETHFIYDPSLTLKKQEPAIELKGNNVKVLYIDFNGNSQNRPTVPTWRGHSGKEAPKKSGNGYDNFIGGQYINNIEIAHCNFYNNFGDGLRVHHIKGISFHHNTASEGGHDVFYALQSENIECYNNSFVTKVNSGLRIMDCSHVRWFNNYITAQGKGAGLAIQIQHDGGTMKDIEVCNNVFDNSYGPGLWLVGKTSGGEDLWLHHNLFLNCGYNTIYWVGGIIASGYDSAKIENNVFDGSYLAAVSFWPYSQSWATEATAYLNSNIFTDSRPGKNSGEGGFGINNEIQKQMVVSENNCYWRNSKADVRGCSVSSSDLFIDPKQNPTPSGWWWTGSEWQCETVKPSEMGDIEDLYDGAEPLTEEELQEFEFSNIFDILKVEFVNSGTANQTEEDIHYTIQKTESGRIAGGIKIIGFKDLIYIDGVPYIPNNDSVLVKYEAVKAPSFSWDTTGVSKIKKDVDIKIEDGNATATLTVKMRWFKLSTDSTGATQKKYKTSKAVFSDTVKAPHVLNRPSELRGTLYEYPLHSLAYVPSSGLTQVEYEYDGKEVNHIYMVGEQRRNENGVIYTNFSQVNYWEGDLPHTGEFLYINGSFDPENLTVTAYTPYESFQVTHFDYLKKDYPDKFYADWLFPSVGLFVILGFGAWYYIRKILY